MPVATIARPRTLAKPKAPVARRAGRDDSDLKLDSIRRMSWIEEGGIDLRGARAEAAAKRASQKKSKAKARPKARARVRTKAKRGAKAKASPRSRGW